MIIKKIPNPKAHSPKASRIGSLLDYIEAQTEKKVELRFAAGDFLTESRQGQRAEMIALAGEAVRSRDPIDHWLLSWKAGEQPSAAECREAVEILKRYLGMSVDHQAICALHSNTENTHLHIVLNRTDPETFRVADNGWSIDRAHQALAEIVQRQGWEQETNAVYQTGRGEKRRDKGVSGPCTKARDFENATGAKSTERIAMEEVPKLLRSARSWSDVHSALAARGFRYELKGSGALVWLGETAVKASAIGREFSRKRMEERFGPLEPTAEKVAVAPTAQVLKPLRAEEGNRWQEYRTFLETHRLERDQAQRALRTSQRGAREEQIASFRGEREALYAGGRWYGDSLNVARSLMAADQARRKAALTSEQEAEREVMRKFLGPRPTYEQFLRAAGQDQLADLWRYRKALPELASLSGEGTDEPARHDIRNFQTRIEHVAGKHKLSVGYYAQGRPEMLSFVDRGKQIDIYQRTDRATVLAALQVASQKWGVVTVTGPAEFQVLCAELAREHGFRIQNLPVRAAITRQEKGAQASAGEASSPTPYEVHRQDISENLKIRNRSRLDWMIAVRMRVTGHTLFTVTRELADHSGSGRAGESRDWELYAKRTAEAAFGARGDRESTYFADRRVTWTRLEGRAVEEELRQPEKIAKRSKQNYLAGRLGPEMGD